MKNLGKLAALIVGLVSLVLGLGAWIHPAQLGDMIGLQGIGVLGEHSLRGDIGAVFLGSALGCAIALFKGKAAGMKLPIILYGLVLVGRLLSLILSGTAPDVYQPIIIEVVFIALSYFAYKQMKSA